MFYLLHFCKKTYIACNFFCASFEVPEYNYNPSDRSLIHCKNRETFLKTDNYMSQQIRLTAFIMNQKQILNICHVSYEVLYFWQGIVKYGQMNLWILVFIYCILRCYTMYQRPYTLTHIKKVFVKTAQSKIILHFVT